MKILLFLLSIGAGALGFVYFPTSRPTVGVLFFVIAAIFFSAAAIIESIQTVGKRIEASKPPPPPLL